MSTFVIGYYALLIGASCLAAFYQKRQIFILVFSLTLVSFVMGIIGGVSALRFITIAAGLLALAAGTSFAFREFLIIITPGRRGEGIADSSVDGGLWHVRYFHICNRRNIRACDRTIWRG
ncbi:peptide/nickel transport system permease protein [Roseibium hamelinense]|uniref:Peptide/nickel transport system permease protein n=1 Tax=Roseibium hamelinense TaxID=150831 RepID=A0A562SYL0_9HYPH|nr:hypothetical protein [Roseibium hamelinense]TWI86034.1 peptide/nickel transport system permease protein [Roseibium hamelinense]